jgi:hypothetical protein
MGRLLIIVISKLLSPLPVDMWQLLILVGLLAAGVGYCCYQEARRDIVVTVTNLSTGLKSNFYLPRKTDYASFRKLLDSAAGKPVLKATYTQAWDGTYLLTEEQYYNFWRPGHYQKSLSVSTEVPPTPVPNQDWKLKLHRKEDGWEWVSNVPQRAEELRRNHHCKGKVTTAKPSKATLQIRSAGLPPFPA